MCLILESFYFFFLICNHGDLDAFTGLHHHYDALSNETIHITMLSINVK